MNETLRIAMGVVALLFGFAVVMGLAVWMARVLGPVLERWLTPRAVLCARPTLHDLVVETPSRPWSPEHPAYVRRDGQWFKAPPLRDAPVVFCGWMPSLPGRPSLELWNLVEDIPGHPRGSTLSRQTLERIAAVSRESDACEDTVGLGDRMAAIARARCEAFANDVLQFSKWIQQQQKQMHGGN